MNIEKNNWVKDNLIGIVSISFTLLTFVYFGVIAGNSNAKDIAAQKEVIIEMKIQIKSLEEKKVDKEIIMMIQTSLVNIQNDVREVRNNQIINGIR